MNCNPSLHKGCAALDTWSVAHFASGAALAKLGCKPGLAWCLLIGFEVPEAELRNGARPGAPGSGLFEYESGPNSAADIIVGMAGYYLAR